MKTKLVLLLIAAMGSTALVATAQTPGPYVVTTARSAEGQNVLASIPAPPQPPGAVSLPAPVAAPAPPGVRNSFYSYRPQAFSVTFDENGTSHQAERLVQQIASAKSDSDRERIKDQLTDLLGKQFDERQKRHQEEIKQLEDQIKKLRDMVEKRQENRREIIARRLEQIVRESQGLGW